LTSSHIDNPKGISLIRTLYAAHLASYDSKRLFSNVRNSALDLEPKGVVSYNFPAITNRSQSTKYIEERYLSSPLAKAADGTIDQDSVPSEIATFDALSLMPLGHTELLPEPEETIVLYVATSMRRKYGMSFNPPIFRP
jgi:hypothetical protein